MRLFLATAMTLTACNIGGSADVTSTIPSPTVPKACSDPTSPEEALDCVRPVVDAVRTTREVLDLLGILPDYTCGTPRGLYVADVREKLSAEGCVETTVDTTGPERDQLTFALSDCNLEGHRVTGTLALSIAGGDDRIDVGADIDAEVDGHAFVAAVHYGECGDQASYRIAIADEPYSIDVTVTTRDGLPIIGSSTIYLDGTIAIGSDGGSVQALEIDGGSYFPKSGLITVRAGGHHIRVAFEEGSFIHHEVEVTVDQQDPVTLYYF